MPRKARELSALAVKHLVKPGLHFVGGVPGLALQVHSKDARSWVLRVSIGGKRRDMGLGGFPDVPLVNAKEAARAARDKIRTGIDPIAERSAARRALAATDVQTIKFKDAAAKYIDAQEAGWRNDKHIQQWRNSLETYAYPIIGKIDVHDITLAHILKILDPIWTTKTETASRVRGRVEKVLDWAKSRGYRDGENPARWRGHLDNLLAEPSKVAKVRHQPALAWRDIGTFMTKLRAVDGMGARATEFAILTATRSGEVRGARWSEIDLAKAVWTIPAERMKAKKEHGVPLSAAAVSLLKAVPRMACSDPSKDWVFPAPRGGQLSDMTLTAVLRRMHQSETAKGNEGWVEPASSRVIVLHGFRSTFREWAGETTAYPREVIEHALAHQLADKAEAAYQRGSLFPKRTLLMEDWAAFCWKGGRGYVLPLRTATA